MEVLKGYLASNCYKRDQQLFKKHSDKTSGRRGSSAEWKKIIDFLFSNYYYSRSNYSGLILNLCKRGNLYQISIQRGNDWWSYYENFLQGLLSFCTSAEQRLFPVQAKTASEKLAHLNFICDLMEEGRRNPRMSPPFPPLTPLELEALAAKYRRQDRRGETRDNVSENRQVKTLKENQEWWLCNRQDFITKARGVLESGNVRLLDMDSPISGGVYDLESNRAVFHFLNNFMEAWSKGHRDIAIRSNFALRSKKYRPQLLAAVRELEIELAKDDKKYVECRKYLETLEKFVLESSSERSGLWNPLHTQDQKTRANELLGTDPDFVPQPSEKERWLIETGYMTDGEDDDFESESRY